MRLRSPGPSLAALLLAGAVLLLGSSCENDEDPLSARGNLPPDTGITSVGAVPGLVTLDTTSYRQEISWWGLDPDGEVVGFYYRWCYFESETCSVGDTGWVFTTATTDSFVLSVPDSFAIHRFEVKAVDELGLVDPAPAVVVLPVNNSPPQLELAGPALPVTGFPVLALVFRFQDPDGINTFQGFRVWLDGDEPDTMALYPSDELTYNPADSTHELVLGRARFGDRIDEFRTVYARGVDNGDGTTARFQYTWRVTPPQAGVLVVDDFPGSVVTLDNRYKNALDAYLGAGNYQVHDIMAQGRLFRTSREAVEILRLFEGGGSFGTPPRRACERP